MHLGIWTIVENDISYAILLYMCVWLAFVGFIIVIVSVGFS
jgi:hypothetical protein